MSDEIEYGAILTQWGKGKEVDTEDLINALAWRMNNQRREIARLSAAQARIAELEALLTELIDIEGPQPGHIEWYRKVLAALNREGEP